MKNKSESCKSLILIPLVMYPLWSASILENSSLMAWSVKIKVGRAQVGLSLHRSRRAASPRTWRTRWSRCPDCRPCPRRGWGLWPPHPPSDLRPGGEIQYIYYNEDDDDTLEMRLVSSSAEMRPSPSASKSLKALEKMREMLVNKFLLYFTSLSSVSLAPAIVWYVLRLRSQKLTEHLMSQKSKTSLSSHKIGSPKLFSLIINILNSFGEGSYVSVCKKLSKNIYLF